MIVLSLEEFASKRKKQQTDLEDDLRPFVKRALDTSEDTHGWIELLQEVRTSWKRAYASETGLRSPQMPTRFRDQIENVLKQTDRTAIDEHTVDRITIWLATAILGNVTVTAADDDPTDLMVEWVTMEDENVRDAHRQAAGQRQKPGDHFKVGPVEMLAPGDPTVPIEYWINDRCSLRVVLADSAMQSRIDASIELRDVSTKERKKDASEGRALPDGSFPIDNCSDLKNAIQAIGRAKDPGKAKAHIRKRKRALGCPEVELPDTWALTAAAPPPEGSPTHAGMVVKAHDTGRVLMIQRKNDPEDAPEVQATWEFPGGRIEDGIDDGPEQAAWREFCEETGLSQPDGEMVGGWLSEDGVYQGFVYLVPFESGAFEHINPNLDGADTQNPDNPERRHPDVAAWFTVEQATGLGASLRPEVASMDWGPMADPEENMEFPEDEQDDTEEESMSASATEAPEAPVEDTPIELEWHSVWTVEGMKTGDGRRFGNGAFRSRPLPLPLTWQKVADEGHKGNVTVGRTDRLVRVATGDDQGEIRASGKWLGNVEANELIGLVAEFGKFGISIDADDTTFDLNDDEQCVDFSDARACSACVVAIPAFSEAWIALGPPPEGFMDGEDLAIEGPNDHVDALVAADISPGLTEDGPGWLTNYVPTDRLRDWWASAESGVNWGVPGDFRRCELAAAKYVKPQYLAGFCANRHYDALGFWPGQEGTVGASLTDTEPAPSINLVASGGFCVPSETFDDPGFAVDDGWLVKQSHGKYGCPLRIVEHDGYTEVFGHLALWNVCHSAIDQKCMLAPRSNNDYAYFRLGAVMTDKGEVPTGCLTIGGGHASMRLRMRPAMEHYDNSTAAWADVNVGEDEFGIWFHGIVRPGTTEEMLHAARASKLSGDWRKGDLIAALSVNVPGFAVPRVAASMEGDEIRALVAAGAVEDPEPVDATASQMADMVEQVAAIIETRRANREAMAVLAQRFVVANREEMLALAARVNGDG